MLGFFNLGLNNICFIVLANTLHALGFSARGERCTVIL